MARDNEDRTIERGPRNALIRRDILRMAATLFSERGFSSTNLKDIAEAVGLSRPAVYYYFKNKDEVLTALIDQATSYPVSVFEKYRRDTSRSCSERLQGAIKELVLWVLEFPVLIRVLESHLSELPSDVAIEHSKAKKRVLRAFVDMISDGIDTGEFREADPRLAAFAVLGMCNWTAWWYREEGEKSRTEVADLFATIAVTALRWSDGRVRNRKDLVSLIGALKDDISALETAVASR